MKSTFLLAVLVSSLVLAGCSGGDPNVNAATPPEAPGLTPTTPGGASNGAGNVSSNNTGLPGSSQRR